MSTAKKNNVNFCFTERKWISTSAGTVYNNGNGVLYNNTGLLFNVSRIGDEFYPGEGSVRMQPWSTFTRVYGYGTGQAIIIRSNNGKDVQPYYYINGGQTIEVPKIGYDSLGYYQNVRTTHFVKLST